MKLNEKIKKYRYIGFFVEKTELDNKLALCLPWTKRLEKEIINPHVTLEYLPEIYYEELFGSEVSIECLGYGNNGRNEGLAVRIHSDSQFINTLVKRINIPHLTISVSEESKSVKTKELSFEEIPVFWLRGVFYGYINKE